MRLVIAALALTISPWVWANIFDLGGREVTIPSPSGFVMVTESMGDVHRYLEAMPDPNSDLLAGYVLEAAVPEIMKGSSLSLERYCLLKASRGLRSRNFSREDFETVRELVRSSNMEAIAELTKRMPDLMGEGTAAMSKELKASFAFDIAQMIPLDVHFETKDVFAYSMFVKMTTTIDGRPKDRITVVTASFVNLGGKVVFFNCYGAEDDLEQTRSTSKTWVTEAIIQSARATPEVKAANVAEQAVTDARRPETLGEALKLLASLDQSYRNLVLVTLYGEVNEKDQELLFDTPEHKVWSLKVMAAERKMMSDLAKRAEWKELQDLLLASANDFGDLIRGGSPIEFSRKAELWELEWVALMSSELEKYDGAVSISQTQRDHISGLSRALMTYVVAGAKDFASGSPLLKGKRTN